MSPYSNRYSTLVVKRARKLKKAGWSSKRIAELIEREMGVKPSPTIIRHWCSEKEKTELDLKRDRKYHREAWRRRNPLRPQPRLSEDLKLERMAALLGRGLSPEDVGQATFVWFGEELTGDEVRKKLGLELAA
jgi:hypothetical protein